MSERLEKARLVCISRMVEGTTPLVANRVLAELEAAVWEAAMERAATEASNCWFNILINWFAKPAIICRAIAERIRTLKTEVPNL